MFSLTDYANDIAGFLCISTAESEAKLSRGFGVLHGEVAASWRAATINNMAHVLEWYRTTDAYIWELTAYHLDAGFNYIAQAQSIADALFAHGRQRILVLADGIGDMTLICSRRDVSIECWYNDLADSMTAAFAAYRAQRHGLEMRQLLTSSFAPSIGGKWDAILAQDFLEHVPNVPEWVEAIHTCLNPGGLLFAQNAFGVGSGDTGSIPCHLAINDRFERDWDPMLQDIGFSQLASNWYKKAA